MAMTALEYLDGCRNADGTWTIEMGRDRQGAFGGAFGGFLAAAAVAVARVASGDRLPSGLDARFVRVLPTGEATLCVDTVHTGRSLSVIDVVVRDERDRVATRASVTLVDPGVLRPLDHPGHGPDPPRVVYREGRPWTSPHGVTIPILETLAPRAVGHGELGHATALRVPWDDADGSAEAACLAADMCTGPPVAGAFEGAWSPHPNTDLSLRFAGREVGAEVVGWGRLERMDGGLATVRVEVRSGDALVAAGVATSLVLPLPTSPSGSGH